MARVQSRCANPKPERRFEQLALRRVTAIHERDERGLYLSYKVHGCVGRLQRVGQRISGLVAYLGIAQIELPNTQAPKKR